MAGNGLFSASQIGVKDRRNGQPKVIERIFWDIRRDALRNFIEREMER